MHRPTIDVYESEGAGYATRRGVQHPERAVAFAASVRPDGLRLDLGSGPGQYSGLLGPPAIALDGAHAMALATRQGAAGPPTPAVVADVACLPFARGSAAGVWASKVYQHLPATDLPLALADLHRVTEVGAPVALTLFGGSATVEEVSTPASGDDLPGRHFTWWEPEQLRAVAEAAGFTVDDLRVVPVAAAPSHPRLELDLTAARALPDHVGPGMRLLCCGLNPSLHAADAGVGYVTPGNRFWPALALAGLSEVDRDPFALLRRDHIGMTDLVKRPTARADELTRDEYREGVKRLDRLCAWLQPQAVAVVGLAGWRAAVDRKAKPGWQDRRHGDAPVYVLPSTSGLNAGTSLAAIAEHLRAAADGPEDAGTT